MAGRMAEVASPHPARRKLSEMSVPKYRLAGPANTGQPASNTHLLALVAALELARILRQPKSPLATQALWQHHPALA